MYERESMFEKEMLISYDLQMTLPQKNLIEVEIMRPYQHYQN